MSLTEWARANGVHSQTARKRRFLSDPAATVVVVEDRDRRGRMNTELVEATLPVSGRRLVVVDDGEVEDGLVRDMTEVLTSFCARPYGRRSARNRARRALECAGAPVGGEPV